MLRRLVAPLVSLILLLGLTSACGPAATSGTSLVEGRKIGNLAYDFSLQALGGKTITLSGLQGHPVILNFWSTT